MTGMSVRIVDSLLTGWRTDVAAYLSLADRLRLLILDGRIPVGERLPSERELALRLGVSRTTVAATYAELRTSGYLDSRRGSGSVARIPGLGAHGDPVDIDYPGATEGLLDFSKAAMPAASELAQAAVRAAAQLPAFFGETGFDPLGLPMLRRAIAGRYEARGLETSADQIMVTVGAQSAIALLARVLLARGDVAIAEAPSYPHAYEALRLAGARIATVGVTSTGANGASDSGAEHISHTGWDSLALERVLRRTSPAMAYVMPDFHNPTGSTMSPALRHRMLELAAGPGTVMVADETMAELDIDTAGELPKPLPAYGAAVAIGSLGKTVWGGLRIGWIRAEPHLIHRLVRARPTTDLGTPILEQIIATDLLSDYGSILARRREQLRAGRDHLERGLASALPGWVVPHVTGGLTTWVELPEPVSSRLTIAARREGLALASGARFGIDGAFERFVRIPFSYSMGETDVAVGALARAWASLGAVADGRSSPSAVAVVDADALLADVV